MPYDLSGISVLLCDPISFRRSLIVDVLRVLGVTQVDPVSEPTIAYRAFRDSLFDLVISEQIMAPLDGLDFTRMIRTSPDSPNTMVPILMVASSPTIRNVEAARDAGVTEYMIMPFSVTSLYSRLAAIIEKPRDFVRDNEYFGPDRRRTVREFLGDDQRASDE